MTVAQTVRDVMTPNPVCLTDDAPVAEAARAMRDNAIGDVLVMKDNRLCGIVTDRDIVVRVLAEGRDPAQTMLREVCTQDTTTVDSSENAERAAKLMRAKAIRRLPVVDGDRPIGIVSIGDLAVEKDPRSALADISGAPPNA